MNLFGYYLGYIDWPYLVLLAVLLISFAVQARVQSTFKKYARIASSQGWTGATAAQDILFRSGVHDVRVETSSRGGLSDHYDPRHKTLRLSQAVYGETSLSALGVAAHEAAHAIQHAEGYRPLQIRDSILPAANIGSYAAFPLFFLGLLLDTGILLHIGIALFTFAVFFQVVTLPVEYNASRRALALLEGGGYLSREEVQGSKKVLSAAALTYVMATITALLQLLRLLLIAGRSRD